MGAQEERSVMVLDSNYWKDFCRRTGMPLDQIEAYDPFIDRAKFEYRYCIKPRRCYATGRWLLLETAVRGRAIWTGPGEPAIEDRWYDSNEALVMMIKKVSE